MPCSLGQQHPGSPIHPGQLVALPLSLPRGMWRSPKGAALQPCPVPGAGFAPSLLSPAPCSALTGPGSFAGPGLSPSPPLWAETERYR